jgi:hypothetical protein
MNKRKERDAARIAELERKLVESQSGQPIRLHLAYRGIEAGGENDLMGSGVVISMTVIGGRQLCEPFLVRDGLSAETIAAIKTDIQRSYALATMYKL